MMIRVEDQLQNKLSHHIHYYLSLFRRSGTAVPTRLQHGLKSDGGHLKSEAAGRLKGGLLLGGLEVGHGCGYG